MAWNEPGNNRKDPWRGNEPDNFDLEELLRKLQAWWNRTTGGRPRGGGSGGSPSLALLGAGVAILLTLWLASGIYVVPPGHQAVVLRFGQYVATTQPGIHWLIPYPIERRELVNVEQVQAREIGYRSGTARQTSAAVPREALMLTQDENIVDVRLAVQYKISDAKDYLFSIQDPHMTLQQVTESALREVIGKSKMDYVLTDGRSEIVAQIQSLLQKVLDSYHAGVLVVRVNLQDAQPPDEVQSAFADAIKAREDEQRQKNEAEAYSNEVLPKARGEAARRLQEAEGYRARVIAQAEGETRRFSQLLTEYEKAPAITRERLYIEALEQVMSNSQKVILDTPNASPLLYLPLDRAPAHPASSHLPVVPLTAELNKMPVTAPAEAQPRETERGRRIRP